MIIQGKPYVLGQGILHVIKYQIGILYCSCTQMILHNISTIILPNFPFYSIFCNFKKDVEIKIIKKIRQQCTFIFFSKSTGPKLN